VPGGFRLADISPGNSAVGNAAGVPADVLVEASAASIAMQPLSALQPRQPKPLSLKIIGFEAALIVENTCPETRRGMNRVSKTGRNT
jgi:hypothetical protein